MSFVISDPFDLCTDSAFHISNLHCFKSIFIISQQNTFSLAQHLAKLLYHV